MKGSSRGKYVYGVVAAYDDLERLIQINLGNYADDGSQHSNNSTHLGKVGISNDSVSIIFYRGLGLIVSEMPFQKAQKIKAEIDAGAGSSIDYILTHQRAVEAARAAGFVVLPIRFGSVVANENIKRLLLNQFQEYLLKLIRLKDKEEYGVKLLLGSNTDRLLSENIEKRTEIQRMKNDVSEKESAGEGAAYFANLKLNDARRNQKLRTMDNIAKRIHVELMNVADTTSSLSADSAQTIFNRAYLVDRSRQKQFVSLVQSIEQEASSLDLAIHTSGPWAPYSFCMDILIDTAQSAKMYDQARKRRGGAI